MTVAKRRKMNPPKDYGLGSAGVTEAMDLQYDEDSGVPHRPLGPGRLSPKFISDLINGALDDGGANILPGDGHHQHNLFLIGNQTVSGDKGDTLSLLCRDCRWHFFIRTSKGEQGQCSLARHNLLHHLVFMKANPADADATKKIWPSVGNVAYLCSAAGCEFTVVVDVLRPYLPEEYIHLLLDNIRIRQQKQEQINRDADRFANTPSEWETNATKTLMMYVGDVLNAPPNSDPRRIAKENKRFLIQFGDSCRKLFEHLDFTELAQGEDEYWLQPKLAPESNVGTELGTQRAFLEGVYNELYCETRRLNIPIDVSAMHRVAVNGFETLQTSLGCHNYPRWHVTQEFGAGVEEAYDFLGACADFQHDLVKYAYESQLNSQKEPSPDYSKKLLSALKCVANVRPADENLIMYTQILASKVESEPTNDVNAAYKSLGLADDCAEDDDFVLKNFDVRISASGASGKADIIDKLSRIGRHRKSAKILAKVAAMDISDALQTLGVPPDSAPEVVSEIMDVDPEVQTTMQRRDDFTVAAALLVIAKKLDPSLPRFHLEEEARKRKQTSAPWLIDLDDAAARSAQTNMDIPVGLTNIGNTCYLNSILQYFYTVKSVRDIIQNYEAYRLELTDENVRNRRVGGHNVDGEPGDAVVAKYFVAELQSLFNELKTSNTVACRPTQRLANAALLSTGQLKNPPPAETTNTYGPIGPPTREQIEATADEAQQPPPLPARPGTQSSEAQDGVKVSVKSVADDAASVGSSSTLVEKDGDPDESYVKVNHKVMSNPPATSQTTEGEDVQSPAETKEDVEMVDAGPHVDKPVQTVADVEPLIAEALDNKARSGTAQQDVEEVMGNIISRLHMAIKPTRTDPESGLQLDPMMDTFYCRTTNYTLSSDGGITNRELSLARWVTAYPEKHHGSLYDALDRNFDIDTIEGQSQMRYTTIVALPPILHIHIQRTSSDGRKNENAIRIPDMLYLDRYMDLPQDSDTLKKRRRTWNLKKRLAVLSSYEETETGGFEGNELNDFALMESTNGRDLGDEDEFSMLDGAYDLLPEYDATRAAEKGTGQADHMSVGAIGENLHPEISRDIKRSYEEEAAALVREAESIFASMTTEAYHLHAVICHSGSAGSGHYWVWIYDFDEKVWRKYNDGTVTVESKDKLDKDLDSGKPYYLAYVRDADKEQFVDVPKREPVQGDEAPPPYAEH